MHCGRCHDLCRLHLHPASAYNTTICLADGHGRQALLRMRTVGHKTAVEGTFPFPLVAEAVLCMSLSQGCTAEYRTVLEWSTGDTSAGPATHTVRSAVLQNALPPTNYQHPSYPPAYVDPSRQSVSHCQSVRGGSLAASAGRQLNIDVQK